jgi:hypothetical protein
MTRRTLTIAVTSAHWLFSLGSDIVIPLQFNSLFPHPPSALARRIRPKVAEQFIRRVILARRRSQRT